MLNIHIYIDIPFRVKKLWHRFFKCRHEVGIFEEWHGKYGSYGSYMLCLKCGRKANELEDTCKHLENFFGVCSYCKTRLSKFDCEHEWEEDWETKEKWCLKCGKEQGEGEWHEDAPCA